MYIQKHKNHIYLWTYMKGIYLIIICIGTASKQKCNKRKITGHISLLAFFIHFIMLDIKTLQS